MPDVKDTPVAWTIVRVDCALLPWKALSEEKRAVALKAVKIVSGVLLDDVNKEVDRLNVERAGSDTVYVALYTPLHRT